MTFDGASYEFGGLVAITTEYQRGYWPEYATVSLYLKAEKIRSPFDSAAGNAEVTSVQPFVISDELTATSEPLLPLASVNRKNRLLLLVVL